jgi:hypothetical protein
MRMLPSVYTTYLCDPSCEPAPEFWGQLRRDLRREMKRRGVSSAHSSLLGHHDFDELLIDCFVFAFLDRLCKLQSRLAESGNVDAIIRLNIANFLTERQKKHDPVGYAAFKNVEGAIKKAVGAGIFEATGRRPGRIDNDTTLIATVAESHVARSRRTDLHLVLTRFDAWRRIVPLAARINHKVQDLLFQCLAQLPPICTQADTGCALRHPSRPLCYRSAGGACERYLEAPEPRGRTVASPGGLRRCQPLGGKRLRFFVGGSRPEGPRRRTGRFAR